MLKKITTLTVIIVTLLSFGNVSAQPDTLKPGDRAFINDVNGKSPLMLSSPDIKGDVLTRLFPGTVVTITNVAQTNNLNWWRVRTHYLEGWILVTVTLNGQSYDTLSIYSDAILEQRITDLSNSISSTPDATSYFNRGLAYFEKFDYSNAGSDLDAALKLTPTDENTLVLHGLINLDRFKSSEALNDFTKVIALAPANPTYRIYHAFANIDLGIYGIALADTKKAANLSSKFVVAFTLQSSIYNEAGDNTNTVKYLIMAIQADPLSAKSHVTLGYVYGIGASPNPQDALDQFTLAIQIEPTYSSAYARRGLFYAMRGQFEQALPDFEKAIQLDPNNGDAYIGMGLTHAMLGDTVQGIADLTQVLQLPGNSSCFSCAYLDLGTIYQHQNENQKAVESYTKSIQSTQGKAITETLIDAYLGRSSAYTSLGNQTAAATDLNTSSALKEQRIQQLSTIH